MVLIILKLKVVFKRYKNKLIFLMVDKVAYNKIKSRE